MLRNALRAVLLDVDFYNRAEIDTRVTWQAGLIVIVASGFAAVGSAVALDDASVVATVAGGVLTGITGWILWSLASWLIGTRVFGGEATFGAMLRVIGFAFTPLAIGIVPWLGFPGAAWMLVAAVVAFREGLDISTAKAIATMAIGWGLWLGTTVLLNIVLDFNLDPSWPFPS
ncbi:MAG: YIP1 family protein [Acidimicrobiia bacterium]